MRNNAGESSGPARRNESVTKPPDDTSPNDAVARQSRNSPGPQLIAFVTWSGLPALSADDQLAAAELETRGATVARTVWDDPAVDWAGFDAVVVRSTWDYHHRPAQFLEWIALLESAGVRVWNPPSLLRWNLDKRYLAELSRRGVAVVPTVTVPRGSDATLADVLVEAGWSQVVVKPAVSASAHETWRTSHQSAGGDASRFARLVRTGDVLVQPYLSAVEAGEWSLCFIGGRFSHAVLKRPRAGEFRVQYELGGEVLALPPPAALIEQAEAIVDLLREPWLYARVDACDIDGALVLMELELIEPTLFFHADPAAPERFAEALRA
jgi:glutathione synthase/RimK-type ligase-like ATP-grasp enzyme